MGRMAERVSVLKHLSYSFLFLLIPLAIYENFPDTRWADAALGVLSMMALLSFTWIGILNERTSNLEKYLEEYLEPTLDKERERVNSLNLRVDVLERRSQQSSQGKSNEVI